MITAEVRSRMRRLYYAEHWKVDTIAAELSVHRETVELALVGIVRRPTMARPRKLDAYHGSSSKRSSSILGYEPRD